MSRFDLAVVGLGSAGIAAARFAATLGVRVVAVERARVGGDCLWTGCVPSKALLASARAAHAARRAGALGVRTGEIGVDGPGVWERIRRVQRDIAAGEDNADALRRCGVEVVEGEARLTSPTTLAVGERTLAARRILLCTGSRPAVPPIPGLADAGYLTSDTLWGLVEPPGRVLVLGAGPVGCEMAQALGRVGARVALVEALPGILARDEPALAHALAGVLTREGVEVVTGARVSRVSTRAGEHTVHADAGGAPRSWTVDAILVATGRSPTIDGLGLEEVGVATGPRGVAVDRRLRTSVRTVYAAGDVTGRHLFTHSAAHDAVTAVRNMLFPGAAAAATPVPWCTFTDPELAHVGLTVPEAEERHGAPRVHAHRSDLAASDRGRADGVEVGELLVVTAKGRIVGAHVLAPGAGEIAHAFLIPVSRRMRLRDLSGLVHVYPTLSWQTALLAAEASYARASRLRFLVRRRS
ncbi:MAG: FAD-dependent oxidoreductase [Actinomycetota bacterium]